MNEDLQRAITAGVVEQTQGGHRCRVCDRDVTEILPHLRGKDHQNNLTWEAISNPAPHPFLLDALPPVVREAKQRGELDVGDKAVFSYKCRVCTKQSVVNGITPLKTHLEGNAHRKAMMLAASSVSPPDPRIHPSHSQPPQVVRVPPSTMPSSTQNPYPASASRNPDPQPYQPPSHQQPQYPPPSNQQLQYPSFDHLQQTRASMPAYNETVQPRLTQPYVSSAQPLAISVSHASAVELTQPPAGSAPYTSTTGAPQPNAPLPAAVPQPTPLPCGDLGARGYNPEIHHALTAEVVEEVLKEGGLPSFKCRACEKELNGTAPCLEHLRSVKHKKKAQAWTQQRQTQTLQPQTPTLTPQPPTLQPQTSMLQPQTSMLQPQTSMLQPQTSMLQPQTSMLQPQTPTLQPPDIRGQVEDGLATSMYDSLKIFDRRNDQADCSFRWTVVTGTPPFQPDDFVYRNLSLPRGFVLIFNYYFTGQGEHERRGAKQDSFNLKTLFERMGYIVDLHGDCNKPETEEVLTSTQNNPKLRNLDSFVVFIMSHGKDDQIFYTASGRDEDCMKLDDVRYRFTDTACPALKGKPKLFFINFCRATREQVAFDGMAPQRPQPEDMVTVYSCINSFRSIRDPENGTYFVQAWCEVLAAHAHSADLQYLHHLAGLRLREMGGPVQELQNYSFKKFYFNPVDTR